VDGFEDDRLGRRARRRERYQHRRPVRSGREFLDHDNHGGRADGASSSHRGVDGLEMLVWGGPDNTGGQWNELSLYVKN
jgi:hypothetical protein